MSLTIIKNADWLVTMDDERRLIRDGTVVIEGDKIIEVSKSNSIKECRNPDKIIDGRGKVVLPGLIDSHIHHSLQLCRGLADECNPQKFLFERLYPLESNLTEEEAYISALLCQIDSLKAGTTCIVDAGNYFPEATLRAFGTSGMRGIVARSAFDVPVSGLGTLPPKFSETTEEALRRGEDFISRNDGAFDGRVGAWFQLRVLSNCSEELLRGLKSISNRLPIRYQAHAALSKEVYEASENLFSKSEIRRLYEADLLGPNMLLAHVGWLTPADMTLIRESGTNLVLCPTSSFHQAMGCVSFGHTPELLESGVTVALGTDGGPHGTNDMVRQMFLASVGYKESRLNVKMMPPETVLEMATLHGAKAIGLEKKIGSLQPGKKADVVIFDANRPEWQPLHNPVANLVYNANGNTAHTVLVDGKILMEKGRIMMVDEDELIQKALHASIAVAKRGGVLKFGQSLWPVA